MKTNTFLTLILTASLISLSCFGQQKLDVTYIANSGFLIETNNKSIIIDALFKKGWDTYLTPSDSVVSNIVNQQAPFEKANLMLIDDFIDMAIFKSSMERKSFVFDRI